MRDIVEVLRYWHSGASIRSVSDRLGVARNTVRKYVREAEQAGIQQGGAPWPIAEWECFVRAHFPEVVDPKTRSQQFAALEPYHQRIADGLRVNHASTVWQRLRDDEGLTVSLSTFRRYIRLTLPDLVSPDTVTVWRPEVSPGEEVQVDFGRLGKLTTQCQQKGAPVVWAFIMVFSYSRHMFVRPVTKMDQLMWLTCHVEAFRFFGGVPKRILLDNLKDGVIKPDLYDPQLNRAYEELASHYGVLLDPCRSASPKDKARVERSVPYCRESFWAGREWRDLAQVKQEAERWCLEVAGERIHRTTRQRPLHHFRQDEMPLLQPLPAQPFEPVEWRTAKVAPDSHCAVHGVLYSVPWRLLGRTLSVRVSQRTVMFYDQGELVKTHVKRPGERRQTDPEDLPPDKVAFYQRNPQWCLKQAQAVGDSCFEAVRQILEANTLTHLRQAQGILRLADTYGAVRLEKACHRAIAFGDPSYRTIRGILQSGQDEQPMHSEMDRSGSVGAFLRGEEAYATSAQGEKKEMCYANASA